jgi:hypothetical protein
MAFNFYLLFPSFCSLQAENYRSPWCIKPSESSHFSSCKPQIYKWKLQTPQMRWSREPTKHRNPQSWILVWRVSCAEFAPNSFNVVKIAWLIEKLFSVRISLKVIFAPVNI